MADAYAPVEAALGADESFLSLADILMSQERLPGRAEVAWPRLAACLARADAAAAPGQALPEGSKLEIPLWLAKGLYDKRRILSVELPKVYKESWRTVFNADASVVDLHKLGPYYYGFGSQLLNFDNPENTELAQSILQVNNFVITTKPSTETDVSYLSQNQVVAVKSLSTFIGRFRHIMDSSQNTFNEDTSALVARLDELERALFQTGQKGLQDFQCWEMGQASQITISSLIQNYKKRKFTDVDS